MKIRSLAALVAGLALAGCANQLSDTLLQHLDRPVDIAFGCTTIITNADQSTEVKAVPTSECGPGGNVTPGQGSVTAVDGGTAPGFTTLALVVEGVRGDVSIANLNLAGVFLDSDPFAPGLNGVPVGRLPVGIVTSPDGCYATVANSGSCDLATMDIAKASRTQPDAVNRVAIRTANGALDARPSAIAAPPSLPPRSVMLDSTLCSAVTGTVYVAFPSCHLVARVDAATGMVLDGIQFHDGAPPELVGSDVTCPSECQGGEQPVAAPDAGTVPPDGGVGGSLLEPGVLTIEPDGTRLYIGGASSPNVYLVDLDSDFKATDVHSVGLEGAGGVRRISASGRVAFSNNTLIYRYLYVIAADNTVHVVDARRTATPVECDTQIDRRNLHGLGGSGQFACFPVGGTNFPRRADAKGPGIRLPDTVVPLDVQFFTNLPQPADSDTPSPSQMRGTFAAISTLGPVVDPTFGRGIVYFVNINDTVYPVREDGTPGDPQNHDIGLAISHTLRDANSLRFSAASPCFPPSVGVTQGGTRIAAAPTRPAVYVYNDDIVPPDAGFAPSIHRAFCGNADAGTITSDWELAMGAPASVRASLFPDLEKAGVRTAVAGGSSNEQIIVTWEGPLTAAVENSHKAGGRVSIDSGGFTIDSPGALLCNLGVQVGDVVDLIGCQSDFDCGVGEVCIIHPDAPSTTTGMCLPKASRDQLLAACAPLLTTLRRYTVVEAADDHTVVVPRPATLFASPIDGCTDDLQCSEIEASFLGDSTLTPHTYHCEPDPAGGGPPQCVVACGAPTDPDCDPGSICDQGTGRCINGPIEVNPDCLAPLQNFEYHAGSAFTIVSSQHEYGSSQKVDPQTGFCVPDATKGPLVLQRFHRLEAPCTDLSITATTPNPCSLNLTEPYTLPNGGGVALRQTYGIRIRSVGITFDMTDIAIPLPGFPGARYSPIFDDYTMVMEIAAGFNPLTTSLFAPLPERIRIAPSTSLYIVDSGDDSANFSTGQVVPLVNIDGTLSPNILK